MSSLFFFFNDPPTTEIYTLSLHDALPISYQAHPVCTTAGNAVLDYLEGHRLFERDRKSTRLNSSHPSISYAVFCLKKKKKPQRLPRHYTPYDYAPRVLSPHARSQ